MYIQRITPAAFAITLLTVGLMNYSPATAQTVSSAPKDPTASVTAKIVEARDYASEFVSLAKASLVQNPADLEQARKLYATAYSKNNAWVAYVKTSIREGNAKKLNKDGAYQTIADDASRSAVEFTTFVNSKTGQSKDVTTILLAFADLGLKLWNGIKDRLYKDRVNAADAFEKDTKWLPWEKIGTDTQRGSEPDTSKK
jgi:hypothetical protein